MLKIKETMLIVVLMIVVSSCNVSISGTSGSSTGTGAYSGPGACYSNSAGYETCIDYAGSNFTVADIQTACATGSMTYLASGCPTTGTNGACIGKCSLPTQTTFYFPSYTTALAQSNCAFYSGTYSSTCP